MVGTRMSVVCCAAALCALSVLAQNVPDQPVDTSTPADWKANCELRRRYQNELIFTAVETTTPDGKRVVAWAARNRSEYVAVFQKLALDGVPKLKQRRDVILKRIAEAPGGSSVALLPELNDLVGGFWRDIEAGAKDHGVVCVPEKK